MPTDKRGEEEEATLGIRKEKRMAAGASRGRRGGREGRRVRCYQDIKKVAPPLLEEREKVILYGIQLREESKSRGEEAGSPVGREEPRYHLHCWLPLYPF